MAITYRYIDIFNMIRGSLGMSEEDNKAIAICNMANEKVWNAFPWRQSLAILPSFGLVPNQQIYGAPEVAVPSDFAGFHMAFLTRATAVPPEYHEIHVRRDLRNTHYRNFPRFVSYDGSQEAFLFDRPAPDNVSGHEWIITGKYKKTPLKVTSLNFGTLLVPWEDRHLSKLVQVMRWAASVATGSGKVDKEQMIAYAAIAEMARDEGFEMGDPNLAPEAPLVGGDSYPGGLFGAY